MKDPKLERIIIEDDVICDYCDRVIPAGSLIFARFSAKEVENGDYYYWCSKECLDNYEAEEFIREFKLGEEEFERGFHETSEDYLDFEEEE